MTTYDLLLAIDPVSLLPKVITGSGGDTLDFTGFVITGLSTSLISDGVASLEASGGNLFTAGVTAIDLDASAALSLNSSGGQLNIGDDADNYNVNVGTGGTRTVKIGSSGGTIHADSRGGNSYLLVGSSSSAWKVASAATGGTDYIALNTSASRLDLVVDIALAEGKHIGMAKVAGETLAVGDVVAVSGTSGKVFKADATGSGTLSTPLGVATRAAAGDGSATRVAFTGEVDMTFGATVATSDIGKLVWLSTGGVAALTYGGSGAGWLLGTVVAASGSTTARVALCRQLISAP
jgi:hypothetical protein